MDFEEIRDYCLSLPDTSEETPFGPEVLVYKVHAKMFALLGFDDSLVTINLKNSPEVNLELREQYDFIVPGYHMNKKHWNTVRVVSQIDRDMLKGLIKASYEAVLPKKKQKPSSS